MRRKFPIKLTLFENNKAINRLESKYSGIVCTTDRVFVNAELISSFRPLDRLSFHIIVQLQLSIEQFEFRIA